MLLKGSYLKVSNLKHVWFKRCNFILAHTLVLFCVFFIDLSAKWFYSKKYLPAFQILLTPLFLNTSNRCTTCLSLRITAYHVYFLSMIVFMTVGYWSSPHHQSIIPRLYYMVFHWHFPLNDLRPLWFVSGINY